MKDPYSRAEEALVSLEQRTQYDEKNRLELLAVHGVIGLLIGPAIYLGDAPPAWLVLFDHASRYYLALPAFFGGLCLLLGLAWNRNILLEAVGMCLLLLWDSMMVYIMVRAGNAAYVPLVYIGMGALMSIHVRTLVRYLKARRKALA